MGAGLQEVQGASRLLKNHCVQGMGEGVALAAFPFLHGRPNLLPVCRYIFPSAVILSSNLSTKFLRLYTNQSHYTCRRSRR